MRPIVKICGIMRTEDAHMCVRLGANILGFVVDYPHPVPWNLSLESATKLIRTVPKPTETCIVTGGLPDKILNLVQTAKPDYIQLHTNETPKDVSYLSNKLKKQGIKIIKTLFPNTPNLKKTAKEFSDAGAYALLLDPRTPGNPITGGSANLPLYTRIRSTVNCPVILAGGINPNNVAEIIHQSTPEIIDLMTGIEQSPGIKDESKVAALFQALNHVTGVGSI